MSPDDTKRARASGALRAENGFPERLRQVIGDRTLRAFAKTIAVSPTVLHQYLKGTSEPTRPVLERIATAVGVHLDWLVRGVGPKEASTGVSSGVVLVPNFGVKVSAGHGLAAVDEHRVQAMPLAPQTLRQLGVSADQLAVVSIRGDSMEPTLHDGDLVVVDTREGQADDLRDGLYVLRVDDDVIVKRLQRMTAGRVLVRSDNAAYAPFELGPERSSAVVGRVVWAGKHFG